METNRLYCLNGLNFEERLRKVGRKELFIKRNLWKYHYLITKLINKYIHVQPKSDRHQLSCYELINKLGQVTVNGKKKYAYSIIRDDLVNWGIIKYYNIIDFPLPGEKKKITSSTTYKILDEWLSKCWYEVKLDKSKFILPVPEKKEQDMTYEGVYKNIQQSLKTVSIDLDKAESWLSEALINKIPLKPKYANYHWNSNREMDKFTHCCWLTILREFEQRKSKITVDFAKTGRVYTSLCNLPRELRQFIKINGKPVVELDIRNSQLLIFTKFIELWAQRKAISNSEDIDFYSTICSEGKFYDVVKSLLQEAGEEVNDAIFKPEFFAKVFFSTEKRQHKWRRIFAARFPNVSKSITYNKGDDYTKLAINLQKLEADIIIKGAVKMLYEAGITEFFTIHDALFTTSENVPAVKDKLLKSFELHNLYPSIRVKSQ